MVSCITYPYQFQLKNLLISLRFKKKEYLVDGKTRKKKVGGSEKAVKQYAYYNIKVLQ